MDRRFIQGIRNIQFRSSRLSKLPTQLVSEMPTVGGFLTGYCHGLDLETCGQMGTLAATYCLECEGTQGHCYTLNEFIARFRQHFDDHGQLDKLLNK